MNSLKCLFVVALAGLILAGSLAAQESPKKALIGQWREYSPGDNLVEFDRGGGLKIFMKKGNSGIPTPKFLQGKWELAKDGTLTLTVSILGKTLPTQTPKLTFEGEEMVLTEKNGKVIRHRKHTGPLPAEYDW